jgi:hypothetical protein
MDYFKDKEYITRSMLMRLLQDSNTFTKWWNGEYEYPTTMPMTLGSIAHDDIFEHLSGGDYQSEFDFEIVDDFRLNSKAGKQYFADVVSKIDKPWVKRPEYEELLRHLNAVKKDDVFIKYFDVMSKKYFLSFEELFTGEINGVKVKVKADIVCRDITDSIVKIIDYKTSSDITKFISSTYAYGYDLQAAMYSDVVGLNLKDDVFDFVVSDKKTDAVKIFKTHSPEFVRRANNKLTYAIDKFKMWKRGDILELNTIIL